MDFLFMQFYIAKKYGKKVEEYFNINKVSVSNWRTSNTVPIRRQLEFQVREGDIDIKKLICSLYP